MVDGQHYQSLVNGDVLIRSQNFYSCCFYNSFIGGIVLFEQDVDVTCSCKEVYLVSFFDVLEQARIGQQGKRFTGLVFFAKAQEDGMNYCKSKVGLEHPQKQGPERSHNLNPKNILGLVDALNGFLK